MRFLTSRGHQPWADIWSRSGWRVQVHPKSGQARLLDPGAAEAVRGPREACVSRARELAPSAGASRAVVLLHGLGDGRGAVEEAEDALERAGWAVANVGYPSLSLDPEAAADGVRSVAHALHEDGAESVDFVAHSLGGLVARLAISRGQDDAWSPARLVLVGSPSGGSAIADKVAGLGPFRMLAGPCGPVLTRSGAAAIPVPRIPTAVIAGGTGGIGFNPFLGGDNDGTVKVSETRIPGCETSFHLVRSLHSSLANHPETVSACLGFLGR